MNFLSKINYNSPFILTFSLVSVAIFAIDALFGNSIMSYFALSGEYHAGSMWWYLSLFLYPLGHGDAAHLMGNLTFLLLLGPAVEEKYGTQKLVLVSLITTVVTGILNTLLFANGILGASGLVFMLIIMSSFTNNQTGKIPLTFILVTILFIGREIVDSFSADNVSQFGHIIGGICGAVFVFYDLQNRKKLGGSGGMEV